MSPVTLAPNLSAQFNGGALGLQLLAFLNNRSMWLRKRLRAPPPTWAAWGRVVTDGGPVRQISCGVLGLL